MTIEKALEAIENKNLSDLQGLLNGLDINSADGEGYSLLAHAVMSGNFEAAKLLIENGANVDSRDKFNNTPLVLACTSLSDEPSEYQLEMVELLLKNGADVNAKGLNGMTPLSQSIEFENKELFDLLLNHPNIDINLTAENEQPIGVAARVKSQSFFDRLIGDERLKFDLVQAASSGNKNFIDQIIKLKKYEFSALTIKQAAEIAIKNGHNEVVEYITPFILKNLNLEEITKLALMEDVKAENPIHQIKQKKEKLTSLFSSLLGNFPKSGNSTFKLLKDGADIIDGGKALCFAIRANNFEMVKYLVEDMKINPNIFFEYRKYSFPRIPIFLACENNLDNKILRVLLENGANPNVQQHNNLKTPLNQIISWNLGRVDCSVSYIKTLLEFGADPTIKDKWGKDSIQNAKGCLSYGYNKLTEIQAKEVIKLFKEAANEDKKIAQKFNKQFDADLETVVKELRSNKNLKLDDIKTFRDNSKETKKVAVKAKLEKHIGKGEENKKLIENKAVDTKLNILDKIEAVFKGTDKVIVKKAVKEIKKQLDKDGDYEKNRGDRLDKKIAKNRKNSKSK